MKMQRSLGLMGVVMVLAALGATVVAGCGGSNDVSHVDTSAGRSANAAKTRNLSWSGGGDGPIATPKANLDDPTPSPAPSVAPSAEPTTAPDGAL